MAKTHHSRPRKTRSSNAQTNRPAGSIPSPRFAAGYGQLVDLRSTRQPVQRMAKPAARPDQRRSKTAMKTAPMRAVIRNIQNTRLVWDAQELKKLFGAWELPTPLTPVTKRAHAPKTRLADALQCVKAKARRAALFASRSTAKGSHSPKKHFTNLQGCTK